ncbi:oxo-5-beta-steroid 4-dehydrogenase [Seminavis robusta]|uniref:Oxo-5-beta-steroid 4-dehydrogenase n=1 Tax=Seminavis robusta TaxID=568900 RepID=A0A9N8H818_9STRA|nr:oxo-5-beta-steroid 4-dehydrogenase [Seminavis robusta]|eukprot:Sro156_g070950.1 oxo-5-beta-steroid 4-dehydrogenase (374) ;mRNA; f:91783-92904
MKLAAIPLLSFLFGVALITPGKKVSVLSHSLSSSKLGSGSGSGPAKFDAKPCKDLQVPVPVHVNRRQALQTAAAAINSAGLWLPASAAAASTSINPIATLSDGTAFPLASFGLQIYNDESAYRLTLLALEVGYRNFFASVLAGNQRGFAKAVRDSGIPRDQLYICGSVVSNRGVGFEKAYKDTTSGWKRNIEAFAAGNIYYLDQIMLDYPGPDAPSIQGQWASFQDMHAQKLTKTLSLSNFSPTQLDCILKPTTMDPKYNLAVKPVVNQLPYSVAYHPGDVVAQNKQRGILVQAWAPLGGSLGGRFSSSLKGKCAQIGKPYNKSWAQVALRWIVQTGASFTTQSQNKDHFQEDLNIFDFELTAQEMQELSALA